MVNIDFSNHIEMSKLMINSDKYPYALFGETPEGELTKTAIFPNRVELWVYQSNGHVRHQVYWADGVIEELYEGRWDKE